MGRIIGSVVAGHLVTCAVAFGLRSVARMVLGVEGSFRPGSRGGAVGARMRTAS